MALLEARRQAAFSAFQSMWKVIRRFDISEFYSDAKHRISLKASVWLKLVSKSTVNSK